MQEARNMPERWCSTKEVCEYLGVSRDTVLTWINEKGLPTSKVGRNWKYKLSEVEEWVESENAAEFWWLKMQVNRLVK